MSVRIISPLFYLIIFSYGAGEKFLSSKNFYVIMTCVMKKFFTFLKNIWVTIFEEKKFVSFFRKMFVSLFLGRR